MVRSNSASNSDTVCLGRTRPMVVAQPYDDRDHKEAARPQPLKTNSSTGFLRVNPILLALQCNYNGEFIW
jgi:hypothetical protein